MGPVPPSHLPAAPIGPPHGGHFGGPGGRRHRGLVDVDRFGVAHAPVGGRGRSGYGPAPGGHPKSRGDAPSARHGLSCWYPGRCRPDSDRPGRRPGDHRCPGRCRPCLRPADAGPDGRARPWPSCAIPGRASPVTASNSNPSRRPRPRGSTATPPLRGDIPVGHRCSTCTPVRPWTDWLGSPPLRSPTRSTLRLCSPRAVRPRSRTSWACTRPAGRPPATVPNRGTCRAGTPQRSPISGLPAWGTGAPWLPMPTGATLAAIQPWLNPTIPVRPLVPTIPPFEPSPPIRLIVGYGAPRSRQMVGA